MVSLEYREENSRIKVGIAMSGGVDSSTVAYLLKKQGYDVFGVTMRTCHAEDEDAKRICDDLGMKHYVLDLREEFEEKVMDYFVEEYLHGRTPNPCMVCNRHIKFGRLLDFILEQGADYMATGHYTKLVDGHLAVGDDSGKDQVYFLSQIHREKLQKILFPVGELEKTQVRELAKTLGVRVYAKKDSQEICFVEDGKLKEFLVEKTAGKVYHKGNIVDRYGNILGKHNGLAFYTIGQRKGLGISSESPLYVVELNAKTNEIVVGSNEDLMRKELIAEKMNLFLVKTLQELHGMECFAKTRSRDILHKCSLEVIGEEVKVSFLENEVRAVTPGQGVVLYNLSGQVIAGGFIKE